MKNLWISLKITLAMCIVLGVGYVLVLRGVSAVAGPNGGEADVVTLDGQIVGAANVGQSFTDSTHFWGRPSAVNYNGGGSGGSNKATTNPEYLAEVEQRVQDFLAAHPYLSRARKFRLKWSRPAARASTPTSHPAVHGYRCGAWPKPAD